MYAVKRKFAAARRQLMIKRIFLLLLALAVVVGILFVTGVLKPGQNPVSSMKLLPFSSSDTYTYDMGSFLYAQNGKVYYYNLNDSGKNWNIQVQTNEVRLAKSENLAVVYNAAAMQIVSTSFPVEFSGSVQNIRCGKSYVAALKKDTTGAYSMQVFDAQAKQIDQISFGNQFIEDFGFFGEADTLWTLSLDYSGTAPVSTITTYTVGQAQAITGIMTLEGQTVEKLEYTAKSLFAIGTNHIVRYTHDVNKEWSRKLIYGWKLMDFAMLQKPTFLLVPRQNNAEGTPSVVKILTLAEDSTNESELLLQLPPGTLGVYLCNNNIVCVTSASLYTYSLAGKLLSQYPFAKAIDSVRKLDDTKILIGRGAEMFIAQLG